jgi:plastocyanin
MRKYWFRSIGLGGLSAIGLVLGLQQSAPAADNVKVEIVRQAGKFVFNPVDVTIAAGQSVEWFSKITGAPHQLVGDQPFKGTARFTPPETATQKFDTPSPKLKYGCTIHPSMQGTITVK